MIKDKGHNMKEIATTRIRYKKWRKRSVKKAITSVNLLLEESYEAI